ncbi:MAG: tetratricopeptide repeat protein, partial [Pirellulaceae bacterium]|nr:tetratricopeptide repeat protein [Pirellulaceae bacterium]
MAAEYTTTRALFLSGKYEEAEALAAEEVEKGTWNERWPRLLIQCQLVRGEYAEALEIYDAAIKRYPTSLTLRMLGVDVIRRNNLIDRAAQEHAGILTQLQSSPSRYASRDNLIAAGRYFNSRGEDARQILQLFFDRVRDADPNYLESYIATAELALQKGDFNVAAETLQAAEKVDATDPRTAYMLARAFESSDSDRARDAIERALDLNPNHIPSLLMVADNAIDGEQYSVADETIKRILAINPTEQEAIALLAVMAHLRGEYDKEIELRDKALKTWSRNPAVDHLIGRKLSQKYRFKEGAEYQRKALTFDPKNSAASFQLAQDLLRLGDEDVGWQLAHTVASEDQYNVVAHNLITLHDRLSQFSTIEADDIHIRMDPREAAIYGDEVVRLLTDARQVLCEKYDVQPNGPIIVEIFPQQKDFAIRTFGLPGGAGFLGVCFGRVITANSPASQGERPSNWRAVLWHEFCHVVTLEKTKNRMPRWLSEGISVYEERQKDSSWGESMTPQYREMLLSDELTPVSQLSAAFLSPPSPIHLQFAYYESSLVIEYLIDQHGIDALKNVLVDLGDGLAINDALARHVGSVDKLDAQFATFARKRAQSFGASADWSKDDLPEKPSLEQISDWVKRYPNNYWGRAALAKALVRRKQFEAAKEHLEHLVDLGAVTGERGGPLETLATVYRETGDLEKERTTLQSIVAMTSDALPSLNRLIQIARDEEDWESVNQYSLKVLAINPLLPSGQSSLAEASEQLDQPEQAVRALRSLTHMEPVDPAGLHFRLASALSKVDQISDAKHHVLAALAEAPRFRDAHRLLLTLVEQESNQDEPPDQTTTDDDAGESQPTDDDLSKSESSNHEPLSQTESETKQSA